MALQGGPRLRAHGQLEVIGLSLGPIAVTKQCEVALQHARYNIKHAGVKGYGKNRMQITKSKLQYNLISRRQDRRFVSQLGRPSTEGPVD